MEGRVDSGGSGVLTAMRACWLIRTLPSGTYGVNSSNFFVINLNSRIDLTPFQIAGFCEESARESP